MAETDQWFQEAFARHQADDLDGAARLYRRLLDVAPDHGEALYLLGSVQVQRGNYADALPLLEQAIARDAGQAKYFNNLGFALKSLMRTGEARGAYEQALRLQPDYPQAVFNLADLEKDAGNLGRAQAGFEHAVTLRPDWAEAQGFLGTVLHVRGFSEQALPYLQKALALGPAGTDSRHTLLGNLGICLQALGRNADARDCYDQILAENPERCEAHLNRALLKLLLGDMTGGWEEYEWRLRSPESPERVYTQPAWDGSPLAGRTLLVHAEQGFGDTFQFLRYLPLIVRDGGRVLFECQPGTQSLLEGCAGFDEIVTPPATGDDRVSHDIQIPLLSLPRLFPHPVDSPPGREAYIHAPEAQADRWGGRLERICADLPRHRPDHLKVGVIWAGNPNHKNDHHRSACLIDFAPLGRVPGVTLFSLQKGPGEAQASDAPAGMTLVDLANLIDDFSDTAAVLQHLDLLITVDTSTAHLAGALGRPVWLLLPFAADFRWLPDREDSPWYPTVRLFRQSRLRDWTTVLARVARELTDMGTRRSPLLPQIEAAEGLFAAGDAPGAMAAFQGLAARHGPHPRVLNNLGVLHWHTGAAEEALTSFLGALQLAPHDPTTRRNCADVLRALGHTEDARMLLGVPDDAPLPRAA